MIPRWDPRPKPCEFCDNVTPTPELLVRPMYVEGELEHWQVCRACYERLRGVINQTVDRVNLPSESSIGD